jgi:N12 class adenine-specific DNA methylase
VGAVAGAQKTLTMIAVSLERARQGVKTIFAVPTLALAEELVAFARRSSDVRS